jgi:hydroxylaminobenzene mutase
MTRNSLADRTALNLTRLGVVLFLAGLVTGFVIPLFDNPRVGLSSHLEGVMNGLFLIALGVIWPKLALSPRANTIGFLLAVFGTFANWLATLLAALWGTGAMMPIAAAGKAGTPVQEIVVSALLMSLSFAMLATCVVVLWGLRSAVRATSA